jgi:predicted nucleotidyltransferase
MDKEMALKTAEQYLSYVRKKYPFENALLFGSFAKGTNHPDSDIDLAIIFKKVDDIIDRQGDLLKLRKDNELIIEPHPFRQSDFNTLDPVAYEIMKNGIEISV